MLIGDSHAAMLSKVVIEAANDLGANSVVFTKSNCKFILANHNLSKLNLALDCYLHNNQILEYLKFHHVDVLIISYDSAKTKDISNIFQNISLLQKYVKRTIFIGPIPEYNLATYLSFHPSADAREESKYISSHLAAFNTSYIDAYEIFCPNYICQNLIGMYYQDYGHLNVRGAEAMKASIKDTLNNPPRV